MTALTVRRRTESLHVRERPGAVERVLVVGLIFLNQFGTPASWFLENTGSASGPASDPLLTVGTLIGIGVLSVGLLGNGDAAVRIVAADVWLVALVGMIGLSVLWSDHAGETLPGALNLGLMYLFAVILLVRFTVREFLGLTSVAFLFGLAMDLAWSLALGSLGRSGNGAWDGLATQKNALGNHAIVGLLVLALAARLYPRHRFVLYLGIAVAAVLLVGSQSKTSLAAGVLTSTSMVVYILFRARRTLFGAVVLSLTTSSIAAALFATANIGLIAGWLDKDVTLTGRTDLWPLVIEGIERRPYLGYGYDGFFQGPLSEAFDIVDQLDWGPTHAHNAFLQVALHIGLIGLFVFLVVNIRALLFSIDYVRKVRGAAGLFPITYLTFALMISFTESGIIGQRFGLMMFFYCVLVVRLGAVGTLAGTGLVRGATIRPTDPPRQALRSPRPSSRIGSENRLPVAVEATRHRSR